jgi:protein TonB
MAVALAAVSSPAAISPAAEAPSAPVESMPQPAMGEAPMAVATHDPHAVSARPIMVRQPEFPVDARLDGIEGWVRFTYVIGRDGAVKSVDIVDAKPRNVFEPAVRKAVRSWRFEPILIDGVPAERQITQTIEFALGRAQRDEEVCYYETGTRICREREPH